jgi:hypothetical protein
MKYWEVLKLEFMPQNIWDVLQYDDNIKDNFVMDGYTDSEPRKQTVARIRKKKPNKQKRSWLASIMLSKRKYDTGFYFHLEKN